VKGIFIYDDSEDMTAAFAAIDLVRQTQSWITGAKPFWHFWT